jgi:hypothetical protein
MTAAVPAVCRDVETASVSESANVSVYESAETWQALGFGLPHVTREVIDNGQDVAQHLPRLRSADGPFNAKPALEFVIGRRSKNSRTKSPPAFSAFRSLAYAPGYGGGLVTMLRW